ncbi:hypothetical protein BLOT_003078 [Blomia tropicalis]|nr:hypothetical protein BLOT_003078 [Blomia tropicalis]
MGYHDQDRKELASYIDRSFDQVNTKLADQISHVQKIKPISVKKKTSKTLFQIWQKLSTNLGHAHYLVLKNH